MPHSLFILSANWLAETARRRGNMLQTQFGLGGAWPVKRELHSGGKGSQGSVTCQGVSDKSCMWLRLWYVVHPSQ